MTEDAALLAAIRAYPAEDTPRLVYADWLDDHEQYDRAAFIRLQVEAARATDPYRRDRLEVEADVFLWRHWFEWLEETAEGLRQVKLGDTMRKFDFTNFTITRTGVSGLCAWHWHRGFISGVFPHWEYFPALAGLFLDLWPIERFDVNRSPQRVFQQDGPVIYVWTSFHQNLPRSLHANSDLPVEVFDLLEHVRFRDAKAARNALRKALLTYARQKTTTSPITPRLTGVLT